MTTEEWNAIELLLDKGFKWREPFGEVQSSVYRTLLDGHSCDLIVDVIRALVARGQVFGPTPGEIVALIRLDPSLPTWAEAYQLLYGRGGVMKAHPKYPPGGWTGSELEEARDRVQLERADALHPMLGAFVRGYGLARLRMLEVDDPAFGELERKRLGEHWARFVVANEGREVASLVAGRRGSLARFDPAEALGVERVEIGR